MRECSLRGGPKGIDQLLRVLVGCVELEELELRHLIQPDSAGVSSADHGAQYF